MKFLTLLLVVLAISHSRSQPMSAGGYANFNTTSNDDPQSCILSLFATITPSNIVLRVFTRDPYQDCTRQDIRFSSIYQNAPISDAESLLTLTNTTTPNSQSVSISITDVIKFNGTACILLSKNLGAGQNQDWYQCRFRFSSVSFHVTFGYYPQNGSFVDNYYDLILPVLGFQALNQSGSPIIKANNSFPQLGGMLATQCGGWSNVITDLNTPLTVTGMIQQSQVVNLATYLMSFSINAIVIRKKSAGPSEYLEWRPQSPRFPFQHPGPNNCFDTGLKYSNLVPDLAYCADGCLVTFMLQNGNVVLDLGTNGFSTKAPSRLRL